MMIEQQVLAFLRRHVSEQVVLMRRENPPEQYYLIEKTGSEVSNHIYSSTIVIQSCAETIEKAATMSDKVIRLMLSEFDTLPFIYGVSLNAEYNFTDTIEKKPRYQAVFDVSHADERSN